MDAAGIYYNIILYARKVLIGNQMHDGGQSHLSRLESRLTHSVLELLHPQSTSKP